MPGVSDLKLGVPTVSATGEPELSEVERRAEGMATVASGVAPMPGASVGAGRKLVRTSEGSLHLVRTRRDDAGTKVL